jgi:hypothetical protein
MGHPTGRIIGVRPPVAFDVEQVFARAAERGVAMEINAQPDRLDLSDAHVRLARSMGVDIVIDTDAHSIPQLENIRYGVFVARRAGLEAADVVNARGWAGFKRWQEERRVKGAERPAVKAKAAAGPKAAVERKGATPKRAGPPRSTAATKPAGAPTRTGTTRKAAKKG